MIPLAGVQLLSSLIPLLSTIFLFHFCLRDCAEGEDEHSVFEGTPPRPLAEVHDVQVHRRNSRRCCVSHSSQVIGRECLLAECFFHVEVAAGVFVFSVDRARR